jgi:transcriptional regulator with XRE-family HTH domain
MPFDRRALGQRLRSLRRQQRLTLKDLSARSGVALSTLSKIELGQVAASYEKFTAVARALGVDIGRLFEAQPAAPAAGPVHTRFAETAGVDAGPYHYRLLAADYAGRRMTPMVGTISARRIEEVPESSRHAGQEFVTVLAGKLSILFEDGHALALSRGESAYFDSGVAHVYLSAGRGDAQVLVVMCE